MVDLRKGRRLPRPRLPDFPGIDVEDVLLALVIAFVVALFAVGIGWCVWEAHHVDQVNQRFADRCHARGGHAVITDKDLCIRNGLVIDWEH